jgi:hypothetical protein
VLLGVRKSVTSERQPRLNSSRRCSLTMGLPEDVHRRLIEGVKKSSEVDPLICVDDVAVLSILREAQKELGIKGK